MRIFGLAGWSGSGKTTLMTALIPEFVARGIEVSTLKHAHHAFDVDQPGKDSWRHRQAGAREVMVVSERRWALMNELRGAPEPGLDELVARMTPVDLLLVEGFKRHPHPKIEIYRPALGKPALYPEDGWIVAVASDATLRGLPLSLLPLGEPAVIADFILRHDGRARWPS
ncbi:MAG TPA: molybdopterin-guanine dinucleotide biosynthesis protein B [Stellaceae bacterium]|jgi:molybdopterin-guanine dinucleotide biosynthesis adapter protein|nr:molybdopterin-guanine dinucleotide biosynthesis protein B [Stellaceae bacterium]